MQPTVEGELEVADSVSSSGSPVQAPASTRTRCLPLPEDLAQVPRVGLVMPTQVLQHIQIAATPRDLSSPMDEDNSPSAPRKPASGPLLPSPVLLPLSPRTNHQAESSPVAASTNEGIVPRTSGDDPMELDDNLTSTGSPAHGALAPPLALVPFARGVNNQESTSSSSTLQPHSTSNAVGHRQPKRGLGDEIATDSDEGGIKAPSKRGSKRGRESGEEVSVTKASTSKSSSRPTRDAPTTPPAWFSTFQKKFLEKDLGMEWKDLVSSWVSFEEKSRNSDVRRLSAAGRPKVVGMWIARKRTTTFLPNISSLEDYESEFYGWWKNLQPTWRISNGKVDKAVSRGDWDCLRCPGVNGVISVVVALFYWGLASDGKLAHRKAWITAVEDCVTVFSLL
jgi:hypothetical protein